MVGTPAFGSPGGDMAYQIRLVEEMSRGENYHLSGFVYQDQQEAQRVAERAGQPYDAFWQEAFYIKGRAMVELSTILGFWVESSHDQNFRWELDTNGRLTVRLILLDLTDGSPISGVWRYKGQQEVLAEWHARVADSNPDASGCR